MDITDLRSISTVLCFIALIGVFYWTYHPKRKNVYDEASQLPFGDDEHISSDSKNKPLETRLEKSGEK